MNKKIHLIYSKNPAEIVNRRSALGSYIYILGGLLLENGYAIYINGEAYHTLKRMDPSVNGNTAKRSFYKRMLPPAVKRISKDIRLFLANRHFINTFNTAEADLFIEFYSYGSSAGYELSVKNHVPLIIVYDAPVIDEYRLFNNAFPFFLKNINRREKRALLKAAFTIVYSNAVKKYVWKKIAKQIPVEIHQNIDFSRFDFIEQKCVGSTLNIGFIGSFLAWHRVDLLVDVFTRLKQEGHNLHLYLLGTGEQFDAIKQKIAFNPYSSDITMPGFMDGAQLLDLKKQIHIGVMPGSNWYGAPNKIFEYGASRMAVVAPDTPTIKDLFTDKEEILLFENGSEIEFYKVLKQLCEEPGRLSQLAENLYRKILTNYSKINTFDFYNRLIREAIQ